MNKDVVAEYHYRRPDGTVTYTINRTKDKQFYPQTDTGLRSLEGVARVPYNLPALLNAGSDTVVLVEGEKSCDDLIKRGFLATCSAGGSAWQWPKEWKEYFKHVNSIVVIADNDDAGRECAKRRARFLKTIISDVRYLELPNVGPKEDVWDFLNVYKRSVDELWKLIEYSPQIKMVEPKTSVDVEQNLIAYILMDGTENPKIFRALSDKDFANPMWAKMFRAAQKLAAVGLKADVPALAVRAIKDGLKFPQKEAEQHLWKLYDMRWDFSTLDIWIDTQIDNASRASVEAATLNIRTMLGEGSSGQELLTAWDTVELRKPVGAVTEAPTLSEFTDVLDPVDWVMPNFLEHKDRFMILAAEGHGKAVLLRQIAVKAAAGIHMWDDKKRTDPVRVLMIDRENSKNQIARSSQRIIKHAEKLVGTGWNENLRILAEPSSINIVNPSDRAWLESQIVSNRPDIVFLMPVYKLYEDSGTTSMEFAAQQFCKIIDDLRYRYNLTICIEHHAPKGNSDEDQTKRKMLPFGSSVWQRWCEMVWGLQTDGNGMKSFNVTTARNNRGETNTKLADAVKNNTIYQPKKMSWNMSAQGWPWLHSDV